MFRQNFLIDPGPIIKPFQVSDGNELQEILIADFILGQQDQMKGGLLDSL